MRAAFLVLMLTLVAGCGAAARESRTAAASSPRPTAAPAPAAAPAPDAALPSGATALAGALAKTTRELDAGITAWRRTNPGVAAVPPDDLALYALYQQRIYRYVRQRPALAQRVIAALPVRLRPQASDNVTAGRSLLMLLPKKPPKTQPPLRVGTAEPPGRLLQWYRQAQERFGVRWQILAAVNFVESGFNRLRNNSYAGAQGPMQFMPATWRTYGLGGDVRDPHDAILGAANYLRASGAAASYRTALYHYNPSPLYVDAITRYARQMQRRPERFYAYWSWQVFVRDKRLTGPGIQS